MTRSNHISLDDLTHVSSADMSSTEAVLKTQRAIPENTSIPHHQPKQIVINPNDPDEDALRIYMLPCLLNIGEAMLSSGADVRQVERILSRVGQAYGADKMNVFVITEVIVVTMTMPSGVEYTQTRRISETASIDFTKLEALNKLCMDCCDDPLPLDELDERYRSIKNKKMGNASLFLGGILCTGAFAVFFGGSWLDGVVAACIGVFICLTMKYWRAYLPNDLIYDFVVAFLSGILIGIAGKLLSGLSESMVTVGAIMILIPGVAMTNSLRDLIAGDTISGVMRLIESLLWAVALALGFMLAMLVLTWVG